MNKWDKNREELRERKRQERVHGVCRPAYGPHSLAVTLSAIFIACGRLQSTHTRTHTHAHTRLPRPPPTPPHPTHALTLALKGNKSDKQNVFLYKIYVVDSLSWSEEIKPARRVLEQWVCFQEYRGAVRGRSQHAW